MTTVDLAGLTFMDLAGVRLFERACLRASANGTRLSLLKGPPSVQRVFSLVANLTNLPTITRRVLELASETKAAA